MAPRKPPAPRGRGRKVTEDSKRFNPLKQGNKTAGRGKGKVTAKNVPGFAQKRVGKAALKRTPAQARGKRR